MSNSSSDLQSKIVYEKTNAVSLIQREKSSTNILVYDLILTKFLFLLSKVKNIWFVCVLPHYMLAVSFTKGISEKRSLDRST